MKTSLYVMPGFLAVTTLLASAAFAESGKWNSNNDPRNFDPKYEFNFNKLQTLTDGDASVDKDGKRTYRGWTDTYWPKTRAYIADRWQQPDAAFNFRKYVLPRGESGVRAMSQQEINLLSPAEKFDIIRGRYDFPIFHEIVTKKFKPTRKEWWHGLCDGWTMSSLNVDEPQAIVYKNPKITNAVAVPLGSSDIKGLLAYYYARRFEPKSSAYVGKFCTRGKRLFGMDGSCKDIDAGAFHVVLVNEIGKKHQGFAMDRDPSPQVWNQAVMKYKTEYFPRAKKAKNAGDDVYRQVDVKTVVYFVDEMYSTDDEMQQNDVTVQPSYDTTIGKVKLSELNYEYTLNLDIADNIIGGEWANTGDIHPDALWRLQFSLPGKATDNKNNPDDWTVLSDILKQATAYTGNVPADDPTKLSGSGAGDLRAASNASDDDGK